MIYVKSFFNEIYKPVYFGNFDGYLTKQCYFSRHMNKLVTLITRQVAVLSLGWLLSVPLYAQSDLPPLALSQLTKPAGWQLVGSVSPNADGTSMQPKPGNTVLVGASEPLTLLTPTADFRLRFDVLMTPNADVVLNLPSGQSISLAHSQEIARLLNQS